MTHTVVLVVLILAGLALAARWALAIRAHANRARRQRAADDAEYRAWQARRDALFDKAPRRA